IAVLDGDHVRDLDLVVIDREREAAEDLAVERRVDHDAEGERVRLLRPEIGVADPVRDPRVSYRRLILDRAAVIRRRSLWSHDRFADRLRAGGTLRAVDVCVRVRAEGT